jgi:hypothetical protein
MNVAVLLVIAGVEQPAVPLASAATDPPYNDVYWVNSCSIYGNVAPALAGGTVGPGFTTAEDCTGGAFGPDASLQINADTPSVGSEGEWAAPTPSPATSIIGI